MCFNQFSLALTDSYFYALVHCNSKIKPQLDAGTISFHGMLPAVRCWEKLQREAAAASLALGRVIAHSTHVTSSSRVPLA